MTLTPLLRRVSRIVVVLSLLAASGCSIAIDDLATTAGADTASAPPTGAEIGAVPGPTSPPAAADETEPSTGDTSDSTDDTDEPNDPAADETAPAEQTPPSSITVDPKAIGAAGVGDLYYPGYGNGGYDVLDYDLVLAWDPEGRLLDGIATINFRTTQPLQQFNLDFVGFDISEITVDGQTANFERQDRELIITAASPIEPNANATVRVVYTGSATAIGSIGAFGGGWTDLGDTIIVAGEPEGAAGWYPVNGHPIDKATYRITVLTDSDLVVASNGTLIESTTEGGLTEWVYESANPQAPYLTTLAIGDLIPHTGDPSESGVPVRHFFHRDVFDESVITMERTGIMIDAFEAIFGPYPFENYGAVVVDADLGFALETQTLSVFGSDLVDRFGSREDVVAHELAHQWFGNHVSLGQWSEIWLNEGFATYAQYLWLEASEAGYDIDAAVRQDHEDLAFLLQVPPGAPPDDDLFNASVYLRGAFTLHALRTTIGDDAFFTLLTTYTNEFGGANARTDEFISLAEDISGQDLQDFFNGWLFEDAVPDLPQ